MTGFDRSEAWRWGVSAVVVLGIHAGAAHALLTYVEPEPAAEPAAAMMIELAMIAESAPEPPAEVAPGPEQVMNEVPPEPVTETAEEPPEPEPTPEPEIEKAEVPPEPEPPPPEELPPPPPEPPVEKAEVVLPRPAPRPAKKPRPKPKPRVETTSAPRPVDARRARASVAPTQGQPSRNPYAISTWRSRLVAHLERHKRYPAGVRDRGVARIAFTVNRSGQVISARLVGSSGSSALDSETLAMIRRASPVPAPPPDVPGSAINLSVPVRYNLR